jgi:Phytanoyl-CoA dioxygenase (PhyH)
MVQPAAALNRISGGLMTVDALDRSGAQHFASLIDTSDLSQCAALFDGLDQRQAGKRITSLALDDLGAVRKTKSLVENYLGANARPVRATLFDKRADRNWSLGWHQDRTIAVKQRREVDGYGPWTVKQGVCHVAPPTSLLTSMLTARVHIDPVDGENAPLLIAPGSHRLGLIAEPEIAGIVTQCGTLECLAEVGDVWLYATLILHASARATHVRRRRVLQIDFSAQSLPGGLEWATA